MIAAEAAAAAKFQVVVTAPKDPSPAGAELMLSRFADKFKLPREKVERLLSHLPAVVKTETDRLRADKWCQILDAIGAESIVRECAAAASETTTAAAAIPRCGEKHPAADMLDPSHAASMQPEAGLVEPASSELDCSKPDWSESNLSVPAKGEETASIVQFEVEAPASPADSQPTPAAAEAAAEPAAEFVFAIEEGGNEAPRPDEAAAVKNDQQFQLNNLIQLMDDNSSAQLSALKQREAEACLESAAAAVQDRPIEAAAAEKGQERSESGAESDPLIGKMESLVTPSYLPPVGSPNRSKKFAAICAAASLAFLLVLAGISAFGPAPEPAIKISDSDLKRMLAAQKAILGRAAAQPDAKPLEKMLKTAESFSGEINESGIKGAVQAKIFEDKIVSLSVELAGSPSEKLSPEQMIAGMKRSPWLTKVEAADLRPDLAKAEPQPLSISGLGRAYVEDDSKNARYALDLIAQGVKNEAGEIELKILLTNINPVPERPERPVLERLKGDRFTILVPLAVKLAKALPAPSPVAEQSVAPAASEPPIGNEPVPAVEAAPKEPLKGDLPAAATMPQ